MKILTAEHLGMCFGVRDAIALARENAAAGSLTILGELVHNPLVLDSLRSRGIQFQKEIQAVTTPNVMITAHGASERAIQQVRSRGFNVLEATCPLVRVAHQALGKLVGQGYHPVIIGKRDHVEVRGMTEDYEDYDVVLNEEDVARLRERSRFGIVAQTTQPIEKVRSLVEQIRARFPEAEVRFSDTVCQPTKQRQYAAATLAKRCDAVVVIGGANSNNTHELVMTCRKHCPRVFHVQNGGELRPEWFQEMEVVGITAGTSTPDSTIQEVANWLRELAPARVEAEASIR
jgi:4-hydroxy-3-methylbut-2-en-1-yl diphosphate reductase